MAAGTPFIARGARGLVIAPATATPDADGLVAAGVMPSCETAGAVAATAHPHALRRAAAPGEYALQAAGTSIYWFLPHAAWGPVAATGTSKFSASLRSLETAGVEEGGLPWSIGEMLEQEPSGVWGAVVTGEARVGDVVWVPGQCLVRVRGLDGSRVEGGRW